SPKSVIGLPSVITNVNPLKIVIVANVAINGAMLPKVTKTPLNTPSKNPPNTPTIKATIGSRPLVIKIDVNALDKANIDPTDKSLPTVKITNVIPKAIKPLIDTCLNKLSKFDKSKNAVFKTLITTTKRINPINGIIFSNNDDLAVNCCI